VTSAAAPVPRGAAALLPLLADCEERLAGAVAGHGPELADPAAATLAAGGKRVRPLLVFCSAPSEALADRARREALVSAAAAVELVHMATLVHDDLLDGATLRRGRPTVAASLGAARAIGTGDFLFARAFGVLTEARRPDAVQHLASAALDLSQGEMDQNRAAFDFDLTEDAYLSRCRRKTAALFAAACRLGALVGGAGPEVQARLAAFGENVGLAFQIFDDILDVAGSPAATGKRRGTDLRDGTVTLPMILAMRLDPGLRSALAAAGSDDDREALCDRLAGHPGLAAARRRALAFVADARTAVTNGPADGADVAALIEIADGVVDRYS
jgi:geranylgeranyl pyrophosphate synthase